MPAKITFWICPKEALLSYFTSLCGSDLKSKVQYFKTLDLSCSGDVREGWFQWECRSGGDGDSGTGLQGQTPFCLLSECREWVRNFPLSSPLSIAHMCQVFLPLQWPWGKRRSSQQTDAFFSRGHWMMDIDATSGMVSSNGCHYRWGSRVTWSRSPSEFVKVSTRCSSINFKTPRSEYN